MSFLDAPGQYWWVSFVQLVPFHVLFFFPSTMLASSFILFSIYLLSLSLLSLLPPPFLIPPRILGGRWKSHLPPIAVTCSSNQSRHICNGSNTHTHTTEAPNNHPASPTSSTQIRKRQNNIKCKRNHFWGKKINFKIVRVSGGYIWISCPFDLFHFLYYYSLYSSFLFLLSVVPMFLLIFRLGRLHALVVVVAFSAVVVERQKKKDGGLVRWNSQSFLSFVPDTFDSFSYCWFCRRVSKVSLTERGGFFFLFSLCRDLTQLSWTGFKFSY